MKPSYPTLLAFLCLAIPACAPATISEQTRSLGPYALDPAVTPGDNVDRELIIIGDPATTNMTIDLDVRQLAPLPPQVTPTSVTISSGDGTVVQTITTDGSITSSAVGGNVARVRLRAPGNLPIPNVTLNALTLTRASGPAIPVDAAQLANRLSSVPLGVGQTVDFAYPAADNYYWFTFTAPREGVYDFAYFGPGRLWIMDGNDTAYPIGTSATADTVPKPGTAVPFVRISLFANEVRRMRADNEGAGAGRARVVVMETTGMQPLAFPSQTPSRFIVTPMGVDHGGYTDDIDVIEQLDCKNWDGQRGVLSNAPLPGYRIAFGPPPCYKDHHGTDWPMLTPLPPPFQTMANVAAAGVVIAVDHTHADFCTLEPFTTKVRCPDAPLSTIAPIDNYVAIRQEDGLIAYYVHGATGSTLVVPGQKVACGEALFVISSAGNSVGPHLHFEMRNLHGGALTDSDRFTNMALLEGQGQSFKPIRSKSDWVDPFGPDVSRWRSLDSADVPRDGCR